MLKVLRWIGPRGAGRLALLAAAALASFAIATSAHAAVPGSLDGSFGSGGIAIATTGTRFFATAVQPDGKLVAVGETGTGSSATLLVARFSTSGALDGSFGQGGLARGPAIGGGAGTASVGNAVAIQPDGKIVVVGTGGSSMLIERFNANGTLDTSFGSAGVVRALESYLGQGFSVAIQPDGKILAGGSGNADGAGGFGPRAAVVRLDANGSLDASFAGGGQDVLTSLPQNSYALGLALQSDGRIVIAGSAAPGQQVTNSLVARLTSSGALDPSFNGTGYTERQYSSGGAYSTFSGVAIQPDGKIVAAGAAVQGGSGADQTILARYDSSGSPDGSFGSGGVVRVNSVSSPPPTSQAVPGGSGVVIAPNGDVVVAGTSGSWPHTSGTLWAFTGGGATDTSFGSGGVATFPSSASNSQYNAIALSPTSGDLLAVGDTSPLAAGAYTGVVAAYIGFGAPAACSSAATLGFNDGFNAGFNRGYTYEFRRAYGPHGAWQSGWRVGFNTARKHGRLRGAYTARASAPARAFSGSPTDPAVLPAGCTDVFNSAFNHGFDTGFHSGFNTAFNRAWRLGYRTGYRAGLR